MFRERKRERNWNSRRDNNARRGTIQKLEKTVISSNFAKETDRFYTSSYYSPTILFSFFFFFKN